MEEEAKRKEEKLETEKQKRLKRKLAAETKWKTRWMIKDLVEDIVMEVRRTGVDPEWLERDRYPEVDVLTVVRDTWSLRTDLMEVDEVPEFRIIQEQTWSVGEEVPEAKEKEDAMYKMTREVENMASVNTTYNPECDKQNV